jgi:hypothetical protein
MVISSIIITGYVDKTVLISFSEEDLMAGACEVSLQVLI